jgi:hypothetical protein
MKHLKRFNESGETIINWSNIRRNGLGWDLAYV